MSYINNMIPIVEGNIVTSGSTITSGFRVVALEDSTITVTFKSAATLTVGVAMDTGKYFKEDEVTSISVDAGKLVKV